MGNPESPEQRSERRRCEADQVVLFLEAVREANIGDTVSWSDHWPADTTIEPPENGPGKVHVMDETGMGEDGKLTVNEANQLAAVLLLARHVGVDLPITN